MKTAKIIIGTVKAVIITTIMVLITEGTGHADVTFTELAYFNGTNGSLIINPLTLGNDGNFYGTTRGDQVALYPSTIFRMSPDGTLSNLVTLAITFFNDTDSFPSALCVGADGNFYGTTQFSSTPSDSGAVFVLTPSGARSNLASFNGFNGYSPSGIIQGADGSFYGCTDGGGPDYQTNGNYGHGTIFHLLADGTLTNLWFADGTTNNFPLGPLVQASDACLYGMTTRLGNGSNRGKIFKISTNGVFQTLVSLNGTNGDLPQAGLTLGIDGNLYGTTMFGGDYFSGIFFRVSTNGTYKILVDFDGTNAYWPNSRLLQASDGNFYGGTQYGGTNGGNGTIFRVTPEGSLTVLYSFSGPSHGFGPITELIQGSDGNFYGGSTFGGPYGRGSVFRLTVPSANLPRLFSSFDTSGMLKLSWIPLPRRTYQLQYSDSPTSTNWTNFGSPISATNSPVVTPIQIAAEFRKFFRVVLLP